MGRTDSAVRLRTPIPNSFDDGGTQNKMLSAVQRELLQNV
jgi:hypothetical protein